MVTTMMKIINSSSNFYFISINRGGSGPAQFTDEEKTKNKKTMNDLSLAKLLDFI